MGNKQFGEKLLEVILLLIGLRMFNTIVYTIAPNFDLGEFTIPILTNLHWIGNIIFGVIIYRLTKQSEEVSMSIGLLATTLPLFGGLFYLLTLLITPRTR